MNQKTAFGVVGGYGATGKVVVSELCKSTSGEIAIAGRDPAKASAFAAQLAEEFQRQLSMRWTTPHSTRFANGARSSSTVLGR